VPPQPLMNFLCKAALPAAFALSNVLFAHPALAADGGVPGVLIVHSNQRPTPAQGVIDNTLRTVVSADLHRPVQLYSEYLDDEWASVQRYGAAEAEFLRDKYGVRDIRVIVADALPALQFAIAFRNRMFPGVPVVHIAVARDRLEQLMLPPGVVGNTENHDPTPTLQMALKLHPETKRLVVIRGASELDRLWDDRVRAAVERLGNGLEVEYLAGLSTAEVLRRVGALSPGAFIFTPGYFVDGTGAVGTPQQSVERIAQAAAVPVYGAFDTLVGSGVVGGYVTRYEDQAKEAGAIVIRLLNGASPAEIPRASVARLPMVDWRQLRRWRINERSLPADTLIEFHEPTVWERNRLGISIAAATVLLQAGLISALLLERRSRRRTASALEESQRKINLAAIAAGLSSWSWDAAHDESRRSARSRPRNGAPREQPVPFEAVVASVHPADRPNLERAVRNAIATGKDLDVEYRVVSADGGIRWITARGRAEEDDPERLIGVALDVTERKAADSRAAEDRTALRHMTRVSLVGQLSAAIAHQLNQPLSAILGNAEVAQRLLGRDKVDVAELRAICADIVSEDHRATEIIRRLRALYNRGDTKIDAIDFNELIRETLDLLRPELMVRHVAPVTEVAPALPPIEGCRVQLQQVVLNLVLNAADAMNEVQREARRLVVRTEAVDGEVRLHVVDNGHGIASAHLAKVFDPFWSMKEGGMGMGLAICRTIVDAHHGRIAASNNVDGGATFAVALPIVRPSPP
jgi:C4-dicarboxylate-specific signal transduction histidine kinase/ABC-type uncharacterized transport system substrate-binding protein